MELISLEPAARQFCQSRLRTFIPTTIGIQAARESLALAQREPVFRHSVQIMTETLFDEINQVEIPVKILYPSDCKEGEKLPVLFYIHGGQFLTGDFQIYDKFIRELCERSRVALVFPEYSLAPEYQAPVQQQQIKQVFDQLPNLANKYQFDLKRIVLSADDVGGAFALTLVQQLTSKQQTSIYKMVLFCPVVNANFDTDSYYMFAGGYGLTREQMKFAWSQYQGSLHARNNPELSPLLMSADHFKQLPETLIITAEADVVRNEGEALARKMRDNGVDVAQIRFQGTVHDFVILNSLDKTNACRLAMNVAVDWIKINLQPKKSI
ncbi:alpha/beta hydrolase [Ligilactobacillus ceti]|uniref:Alpha beta hydrolase fold family protein n=1 Tax=Ligilactobacillus ceti DSM 22408 TaxID=1122146 RepID=A0A0R2KP79_9LACO|nr:alpha/beta hydrolase [Ligilactobacillus ceti]KRN88764.1 alpha beta hydrolase fold family protein [Ligilactobacillus ceti DSM 22408]